MRFTLEYLNISYCYVFHCLNNRSLTSKSTWKTSYIHISVVFKYFMNTPYNSAIVIQVITKARSFRKNKQALTACMSLSAPNQRGARHCNGRYCWSHTSRHLGSAYSSEPSRPNRQTNMKLSSRLKYWFCVYFCDVAYLGNFKGDTVLKLIKGKSYNLCLMGHEKQKQKLRFPLLFFSTLSTNSIFLF